MGVISELLHALFVHSPVSNWVNYSHMIRAEYCVSAQEGALVCKFMSLMKL